MHVVFLLFILTQVYNSTIYLSAHRQRLNEGEDPDLVQRNVDFVRDANVPLVAKYAAVFAFMPIWKWFYYAPNTFKVRQKEKV